MKNRGPLSGGSATVAACGALLLSLFVGLAALHAADPTETGTEIDELFYAKRLHQLAGPKAVVCGFVRPRRDHSAETKCRDDAMARRRPFIYAFKLPHFRWWIGLVMDQSGETTMVEFDHENPERGTIRISPCKVPRFDGPRFDCS